MRPDRLKVFNSILFATYNIALEHYSDEYNAERYVRKALIHYLKDGDTKYFPDPKLKEEMSKNFSQDDVAREIADYLFQYMQTNNAETRMEKRLNVDLFSLEMEGYSEAQIMQQLRNSLLNKTSKFYDIDNDYLREVAAKIYEKNEIRKMIQEQKKYEAEIARRSKNQYGVTNVKVNNEAINLCKQEILSGAQISIQNGISNNNARNGRILQRPRREYSIDDEMFAVTDIGRARENQEDSVLILKHPSNPNYRMLVVADGVGGYEGGEKASHETVKQMIEWYESLNPNYFKEENKRELAQMWSEKLKAIDRDINIKFPKAGSTFVGAIIGDKSTLMCSVGDSRAYMVDNNMELRQMTVDDNIGYKNWQAKWGTVYASSASGKSKATIEKMLDEKDRVRFDKFSNVITDSLGVDAGATPKFVSIPNTAYRTLMLFSDGVTDCLSDKQIMAITRQTKPRDLARAIVDNAINNDSYRPELRNDPYYKSTIPGGKDNTTAAVYTRKRGGNER